MFEYSLLLLVCRWYSAVQREEKRGVKTVSRGYTINDDIMSSSQLVSVCLYVYINVNVHIFINCHSARNILDVFTFYKFSFYSLI